MPKARARRLKEWRADSSESARTSPSATRSNRTTSETDCSRDVRVSTAMRVTWPPWEWAPGIKSPAGGGRSRTVFKRLTARQLARKLGLTQFYTEDAMVGLPPIHSRIRDSGMGHFRVTVHVGNRAGERFEP